MSFITSSGVVDTMPSDGAEHYTIVGYYTGHVARTLQGWRIARYKLTVSFSDGDRRLMGIAYRKATSAV